MKYDPTKHNPCPEYLRGLLAAAGVSQAQAADRVGVSARMMRYYLAPADIKRRKNKQHKPAPYRIQHTLECMANGSDQRPAAYRIDNKRNIYLAGEKHTTFDYYVYRREHEAYVFDGEYAAPGWHKTDERCAAFAAEASL
jgi:hypothetical protein